MERQVRDLKVLREHQMAFSWKDTRHERDRVQILDWGLLEQPPEGLVQPVRLGFVRVLLWVLGALGVDGRKVVGEELLRGWLDRMRGHHYLIQNGAVGRAQRGERVDNGGDCYDSRPFQIVIFKSVIRTISVQRG